MSFKRLEADDFVISSDSITAAMWVGNVPTLTYFFTSSVQAAGQSGNYYLNILHPIIYDLWNYPIKCTDTSIKPMTDKKHQENRESYDLTQYIFERDE